MTVLTRADVEALVIEQGNPERLKLSPEEWKQVYTLYQCCNKDEAGVFILVVGTHIYQGTPRPVLVDLTDSTPIKDILDAKVQLTAEQIEEQEANDTIKEIL